MFQLPPDWRDGDALATAWRAAEPFPHVIVEDFVAAGELDALLAIMDDEGVERFAGDIFDFDASPPQPATPELAAVRDELAAVLGPTLARATGKPAARVELRAYAYRAGHFLLPHSDHRAGLPRALAFAYYLPSPEPPIGGELELYRCTVGGDGELAETISAAVIEPRSNRLVVFDVSDVSLHQVREVLGGIRISLAGWFYP